MIREADLSAVKAITHYSKNLACLNYYWRKLQQFNFIV